MGVTTHLVQSQDTAAQIIEGLKYLGVHHERDDFTCDNCFAGDPNDIVNGFVPIREATGVTFDPLPYLVNSDKATIAFNVSTYEYWLSLSPGAIDFIEGANEPNNFPFVYTNAAGSADPCGPGTGSYTGCIEAQAELYKQVKADPKLAGIPVMSFSEPGGEGNNAGAQFLKVPFASGEVAAGTQLAQYGVVHNYVFNSATPSKGQVDNNAWSTFAPAQAEIERNDGMDGEWCGVTFLGKFPATLYADCPKIPRVTTETGWPQNGAA
jgi:hypothetical protein